MLDRRQFTAATLAAAALPMIPSRARAARRAAEEVFAWTPLGKSVHLAEGGGGNVIYVPATGGALLVDTKNPGYGDSLKREAETRGHAITLTINTHHHGDHTGGNYAMTDGAELLAHANAKPRIAEQLERYRGGFSATIQGGASDEMKREAEARLEKLDTMGDAWMPTAIVDRDDDEYRFGDRAVAFMHVGNGHTDNDLILYLEDENLMHFGDLMFNGLHPYCDASAKASPSGWIKSLEAGLDIADEKTIVVPGHGPVTDRAGIQTQIDYFTQLLENVQAQIDAGRTLDEIRAMTFPFMEGLGFERIRPIAIEVAYDELTG